MNGRGPEVARAFRRDLLGGPRFGGESSIVSSLTVNGKSRFYGIGDPINYDDDINPTVYIEGGLAVNGHTYLNTATVGARFLNISDERRKKDIVPKTRSIISQLKPMQYDLLDKDGKVVHEGDVGFMAQDLKKVDDRIVHVDSNGTHSVDYRAIGVHTVIEMQKMLKVQAELLQKQKELQEQLENMKKKAKQ